MALRDRVARVVLAGYAALETARGVAPELLSVSASVAVEVGVTALTVETALNAGFLLVAFYVFAPVVFPAAVGARRERPGFRAVVAVVALLFALPASLALTAFDALTVPFAVVGGYLLVALLVGLAAFALYFRVTQPVPVADPDGDAFAIVLNQADESASDHRQHLRTLDDESRFGGVVVRCLSVVAATSTYLGPCVLFGLAAATLGSLFPLLEVFVIVGLLFQAGNRVGVVDRTIPDVETRFYDRLTTATRSVRGTAGVLMTVIGIVLAAFLVLLWFRVGAVTWQITNPLDGLLLSLDPARRGPPVHRAAVGLVAGVGAVVALPAASGYAVWYWFRELRRFTALEDESASAHDVARPPGLLVAATGLTVGWFGYTVGDWPAWPVESAFAVCWPILALVLLRNVRRARIDDPAPPSETGWTIPAGFVVYAGGVTTSLTVFLDVAGSIVLSVVFPVWLFYLEGLSERATGVRGRFRLVGYGAALFLGVFALRGPLGVGPVMLWSLAGVVALLILGQLLDHAVDSTSG